MSARDNRTFDRFGTLVAHTARLEGLRKVPDGILRVIDLKLK